MVSGPIVWRKWGLQLSLAVWLSFLGFHFFFGLIFFGLRPDGAPPPSTSLLGRVAFAQDRPATRVRVGLHDIVPLAASTPGGPEGFCIDVLEKIAANADWELEYVHGSWPQCVERLRNKQIDLLFPVFRSDEREAQMDFSEVPLISTWGRVFAPREAEIESILDLEGKVIAGVENDIFYQELQGLLGQFSLRCEFLDLPTSEAVFQSLQDGKSEAAAVERIDGARHSQTHGVPATSIVFHPGLAYFVVPEGERSELLQVLDAELRWMKSDPGSAYHVAYERWIGQGDGRGFPAWARGLFIGIVSLVAFLLIFALVLRRQVYNRTQELQAQNRLLEQEIEERMLAEDALRRSEERLRLSLEAISDGGWDWNIGTDEFFVSQSWLRALGYDRTDVGTGRSFWLGLVHADDRDEVEGNLRAHLQGETQRFECENRLLNRAGEYRWNLTRGKVVSRSRAGEPLRMIGEDTDISELKEGERKRREQEKLSAVGQLAAGIAHEISNPLASISVLSQRVQRRVEDPKLSQKLQLIVDHIQKVGRNVRQMIDLSRPTRTEWSSCSINEVLSAALGLVQHDQRAREVKIQSEFAEPLPRVHAVSDLLTQLFMNLALNAFDALQELGSESERRLRVRSKVVALETGPATPDDSDAGSPARLEVQFDDNGPGIPEELRSQVLEPFFTTKGLGRGTGLGLAVSYGIAKEHGGDIRIEESDLGGARFVVSLPCN